MQEAIVGPGERLTACDQSGSVFRQARTTRQIANQSESISSAERYAAVNRFRPELL
jgi:hypothetical protein